MIIIIDNFSEGRSLNLRPNFVQNCISFDRIFGFGIIFHSHLQPLKGDLYIEIKLFYKAEKTFLKNSRNMPLLDYNYSNKNLQSIFTHIRKLKRGFLHRFSVVSDTAPITGGILYQIDSFPAQCPLYTTYST